MEKALRRQVGADTVELDTIEGYARYSYTLPRAIDFELLQEALNGAAYTLASAQLSVRGVAERGHCQVCEADRLQLRLDGTDQRFDIIAGKLPTGRRLRVTAEARGWEQGHVQLEVLQSVEL